jgi:SAM-dependent methyltransferase
MDAVSKFVRGAILDIGCGRAEIISYLQKEESVKYVGIDSNKELISDLKKRHSFVSFFPIDVDNENLPPYISESKFDTILLVAAIEHLRKPKRILGEASSILREDGRLIITTATPTGERIHNILAILGLTSRQAVEEHSRAAQSSYSYQDLLDLSLPLGYDVEIFQRFEFGFNQLMVLRKRTGACQHRSKCHATC